MNPPLTVHHENWIKIFSNGGHILQSEIPISICDVNMTISNSWPNSKISNEMSTFPQKPTYFLKIHGWIPFNVLLKNGLFSGCFKGSKGFFLIIFSHCLVSGGFGNPPEAQAPQIQSAPSDHPSPKSCQPWLQVSGGSHPNIGKASFTKHFVFRYLKWRKDLTKH